MLTFGSNRASAVLSQVISSSAHMFPFLRCHGCLQRHRPLLGLRSQQLPARSKMLFGQSVSIRFCSPKRPARFIFIYSRERIGSCLGMGALIRAMVRCRGHVSSIGRASHSDLPSVRTIAKLLKPLFVKSAVTSNQAM